VGQEMFRNLRWCGVMIDLGCHQPTY
jgi:hypothetical protein